MNVHYYGRRRHGQLLWITPPWQKVYAGIPSIDRPAIDNLAIDRK